MQPTMHGVVALTRGSTSSLLSWQAIRNYTSEAHMRNSTRNTRRSSSWRAADVPALPCWRSYGRLHAEALQ